MENEGRRNSACAYIQHILQEVRLDGKHAALRLNETDGKASAFKVTRKHVRLRIQCIQGIYNTVHKTGRACRVADITMTFKSALVASSSLNTISMKSVWLWDNKGST